MNGNIPVRPLRCAIYTRKSHEEGLEQDFNSLDAQREACEAYIASQKQEGWLLVPDHYDDGGISGGTMERPGLRRLLEDVEAGHIDVVVVYKLDRLSRALLDFAHMVKLFERHDVTFASVTEHFNTTTSMGRLTLNILLSFAQFERELTAERIRDKHAASRKKGLWMGGNPPLGYDVKKRRLVVNAGEAKLVRHIFERFTQVGSATELVRELAAQGYRTKSWTSRTGRAHGGQPISKGFLYKFLKNPLYIGRVVHKGQIYPGQHDRIVEPKTWHRVQAILAENARRRGNRTRAKTPALLKGVIYCKGCGVAMTPSHTRKKNGRVYRYYVCVNAVKKGYDSCAVKSIAAGEVEEAVVNQVRALIGSPEIIVRTWKQLQKQQPQVTESEVGAALRTLDPLWHELFPAERARILSLLVESVEVGPDGLAIKLRTEGLERLVGELGGPARRQAHCA